MASSPCCFQYPFVVELFPRTTVPSGTCRPVRSAETFAFTVRSLSRAEFARWQGESSTDLLFQDRVLAETVLSRPEQFHGEPWDWDTVYAGLFQQVYEKVMSLSGFGPVPDPMLIGAAEQYLKGEEARYDLLLMTAFNYRLEEILALESELWHRLVGLAEMKLTVIGMDPGAILGLTQGPRGRTTGPTAPGAAMQHLPAAGPVRGGPQSGRTEQAFVFTAD